MATAQMKRLYRRLVKDCFTFLPAGVHALEDINEKVQEKYPGLCDDRVICEHSSSERPEWKHVVRQALNRLKDRPETGISKKGLKRDFWRLGGSAKGATDTTKENPSCGTLPLRGIPANEDTPTEYSRKRNNRTVAARNGVGLRENPTLAASCTVLVEMIEVASLQYAGLSAGQQHFLETIIGAALYYLPSSTELWSGNVSVGLLKTFHPESGITHPKSTNDHEYPRKIAAAELLSKVRWHEVADKTAHLIAEYVTRFGRYHYITAAENQKLKWLQRKHLFTTPQDGYARAGIVLVAVSRAEWLAIRRRDRIAIEQCLERA